MLFYKRLIQWNNLDCIISIYEQYADNKGTELTGRSDKVQQELERGFCLGQSV